MIGPCLGQEALQDLAEGLHLRDGRLVHNLHKVTPAVLQADLHVSLEEAGQQWPVVCSLNPLDPGVHSLHGKFIQREHTFFIGRERYGHTLLNLMP